MSFYVDAAEQRAKARRAEAILQEHSQTRVPRPPSRSYSEYEEEERSALPPVFKREHGYEHARETSVDKRAARFRDTHLYGPPPPPPVSPDAIPRMLPPQRFLVPQELANQGVVNDARFAITENAYPSPTDAQRVAYPPPPLEPLAPLAPPIPRMSRPYEEDDDRDMPPQYVRTPAGIAPNPAYGLPPSPAPMQGWIPPEIAAQIGQPMTTDLTPSQKKRLRRKRAKQNRGDRGPSLAPYPLEIDQQSSMNGHAMLPPPFPSNTVGQTACDHEVILTLRAQGIPQQFRFVCPLSPFPHPGQPHLVKLDTIEPAGTELFIGWWGPGE